MFSAENSKHITNKILHNFDMQLHNFVKQTE